MRGGEGSRGCARGWYETRRDSTETFLFPDSWADEDGVIVCYAWRQVNRGRCEGEGKGNSKKQRNEQIRFGDVNKNSNSKDNSRSLQDDNTKGNGKGEDNDGWSGSAGSAG